MSYLLLLMMLLCVPMVRPGDRVVLMGDSQVEGLSYVMPRLAAADDVALLPVFVSGSSVRQWAEPATQGWNITPQWKAIQAFNPTVILVSLGSNDSYSGAQIKDIDRPYLGDLLAMLQETGARRIVWIGPPKLARAAVGLDAFVGLVKSTGVTYYDSRAVEIDMEPDQLHTTGKGRKQWGYWIWDKLKEDRTCGLR